MSNRDLILLFQDNTDDYFLFERALRKVGIANSIRLVRYFEEATCYLGGVGVYNDRTIYPLPALVIVDLSVLAGTGFKLLRWIRSKPRFSKLPLIALGRSRQDPWVQAAYDAGANAFFVKTLDMSELVATLEDLELIRGILRTESVETSDAGFISSGWQELSSIG